MDEPAPTVNKPDDVKELRTVIESINFFSNPVKFNAIMYEGYLIMLKKLTKIEEMLEKTAQKQ